MTITFDILHKQFNTYLRAETESLLSNYEVFKEPVMQAILEGGKQIRPLLFLESIVNWSNRSPTKDEYRIAVAIELLHAFYLIHDDIMDEDEIRRDSPTLHCAFPHTASGKALALIFGDIIFSKAVELISLHPESTKRTSLLALFFDVNSKTAEGQIRECDHSFIPTKEDLISFYTLKTSYYSIYLPLACASIVCSKEKAHQDALLHMSKHLGIAYQLYDDVIEVMGEKKRRSTDSSGDLLRLKMTPILAEYLLRQSSSKALFYTDKYTQHQELSEEEEQVLRKEIIDSDILDQMKDMIVEHLGISEGFLIAAHLTDSQIIASLYSKYKTF